MDEALVVGPMYQPLHCKFYEILYFIIYIYIRSIVKGLSNNIYKPLLYSIESNDLTKRNVLFFYFFIIFVFARYDLSFRGLFLVPPL